MRRAMLAGVGTLLLVAGGCAREMSPPKILNLVALDDKNTRSISDGAEITINEVVDFQIELTSPAFVYVFLSEGAHSRLAWGHNPTAPQLESGTYAPNWMDEGGLGLGFDLPGEVRLTVVASPKQLANTDRAGALDRLVGECPACGITTAKFRIKPAG